MTGKQPCCWLAAIVADLHPYAGLNVATPASSHKPLAVRTNAGVYQIALPMKAVAPQTGETLTGTDSFKLAR